MDLLKESTMKFCDNLASKPQSILVLIKALINNFYLGALESFFEKEREAFNLAMSGEVDKFDAFIQKIWTNK